MRSPSSSESAFCAPGQMIVTQPDGRQQVRGTGFLDRLVGATDLPVFHTSMSYRAPHSVGSHNRRSSYLLSSPTISNQTRTPPALMSPMLHSLDAQSDGDDDDDDCDDSDSPVMSSGATSFVASHRLNPAQLRRKHDAEVKRLKEEIEASAREGSTALKLLRVGTQAEKAAVARVFKELEQPEMKDTVRLDAAAAIQSKERKYYSFVSSVMGPATALLRSMWDHRRVGTLERAAFSEKHFLQDAKNFVAINNEVAKYQRTKNSELVLIRLAGLRETILATLRQLLTASILSDPHISVASAEVHAIDVFNALLQLRHVTCEIVDVVTAKREDEGHLKAEPLLWEGENYMIRMQGDVAKVLGDTQAFVLLGDKYPFAMNPMILPSDLHQLSRDDLGSREMKSQLPGPSRAATPAGTSSSPAARRPSRLRPPTTTSSNSSPVLPNTSSPVVLAKEGEVLGTAMEKLQEGSSGLHKTLSQRNIFFKRRMSEIQRAATKIEMDRSNVYQYPASVYKPPPRPSWVRVAEMLQRSLDPRIRSSGYDENQEYERLQFGRITTPPSFFTPWRNPVVDEATQCFRTVVPDHQRFTYAELHKREVLIFGEQSFIRSQRCRRRFRRGMAKLSMAYRGFIVSLRNRRRGAAATADEFLEWVRCVCPDWLEEAREGLSTQGSSDEAIAQQIFVENDLDDDV